MKKNILIKYFIKRFTMGFPIIGGIGAIGAMLYGLYILCWTVVGLAFSVQLLHAAAQDYDRMQLESKLHRNPFVAGIQRWYYTKVKPDLRRNTGKYITYSFQTNNQFE